MIKNIKKKKGFTLIELIIVIAIIGILAAIAVPKYAGIQKDARAKTDIATAKTIADAVTVLVAQGKIPETITSVQITTDTGTEPVVTDADAAAQIGKYLQSIPESSVYKGEKFTVAVVKGNAIISVNDAVVKKDIVVYPNAIEDPYKK